MCVKAVGVPFTRGVTARRSVWPAENACGLDSTCFCLAGAIPFSALDFLFVSWRRNDGVGGPRLALISLAQGGL